MVFTKEAVEGTWKWGEHDLPTFAKYIFLGIDFTSNGAWDGHIKKVLDCGWKRGEGEGETDFIFSAA